MNKRLVLIVMAILLLTSAAFVNAQEVVTATPTPDLVVTSETPTATPDSSTPVVIETPAVTPDPNRCDKNYLTFTRSGVSVRYYQYQYPWAVFTTTGVTGSITINSQNYGMTIYLGKLNFTTGVYNFPYSTHVDAGTDLTYMIDNLNSPVLVVVYDCTPLEGTATVTPSDLPAGQMSIDTSCLSKIQPKLDTLYMPAEYTFNGGYILPIFSAGGNLTVTSTLPFNAVVGKWFSDQGDNVRGIEEGWREYDSTKVGTATQWSINTSINSGDASILTVTCP